MPVDNCGLWFTSLVQVLQETILQVYRSALLAAQEGMAILTGQKRQFRLPLVSLFAPYRQRNQDARSKVTEPVAEISHETCQVKVSTPLGVATPCTPTNCKSTLLYHSSRHFGLSPPVTIRIDQMDPLTPFSVSALFGCPTPGGALRGTLIGTTELNEEILL